MKPYYAEDGITIYHGDCRRLVQPPGLALVSDPPYGIGLENRDVDGHRSEWTGIHGDDSSDSGMVMLEYARTRGYDPIVYFASPWRPWPGRWRNLIAWDKGGAVGGGGDIKTCLKRSWELIQVFNGAALQGGRRESIWRSRQTPAGTAAHIAAKPVDLMERLIATFAPPDRIIFDPFMGSGTTLVAAKNLGRRAIGIEIEERYCEIAAQRLAQGVLDFGGAA